MPQDLTTLLYESFEGGVMPPAGWSVIDGTSSTRHWQLVDTGSNPAWIHSGTYAGWVNYEALDQDEWLISPLMDFTGVQTPYVEFWTYANNNWVANGELQFLVIDGSGTFTDTLWQQSSETWPYPSTYHQVVVDLSAYEDQDVYLAWRYVGNDGDSIALDDISVIGDIPSEVEVTFQATVSGIGMEVITNMAELSYMGTMQEAQTALQINASYGVEVEPTSAALIGLTGSNVEYTLTVTNTGNTADTFDIEVSGNAWLTDAPASIGLLPGESMDVTVTVSVPGGAADGAADVATVTFTSQGDGNVSASAELTTTADVAVNFIYLPIVSK
jgi:hypothetical protein